MTCKTQSEEYQAVRNDVQWQSGRNLNLSRQAIEKIFAENESNGSVYAYVIATIKNIKGKLCQTGCGPNFIGGRTTLCTCKHFMRTFCSEDQWRGHWIAGFTGVDEGERRNVLVYLMQIEIAFRSHITLWRFYSRQPGGSRLLTVKNARYSRFGDIYEPKVPDIRWTDEDEFTAEKYYAPIKDHEHSSPKHPDDWKNDIEYENKRWGRRPALLVGDPSLSFLWIQPQVRMKNFKSLGRGQKKFQSVNDFSNLLEEI